MEKLLLCRNCSFFLGVAKNFGKSLKQNISLYYCIISYYYQKRGINDESCFSARAGKIDLLLRDI